MGLMRTLLLIGGGVAAYRLIKNRRHKGAMTDPVTTRRGFVRHAAECNLLATRLGHLALEKSRNDTIRQFAQRLIDDHDRNHAQLREIAVKLGCTVPNVMPDADLQIVERMGAMEPESFDRSFVDFMVDAHKQDVNVFERAAGTIDSDDLRAFANDTLAMLREHLQVIETIANRQRQAA